MGAFTRQGRVWMRAAALIVLLTIAAISSAQFQSGSPWPRWQGNAQNTAMALGNGTQNTVKWSYNTGSAASQGIQTGVAVSATGTVYFGTGDGHLYAITDFNGAGTVSWTYSTLSNASVTSTPMVGSDGTIYFGDNNGVFYAVTSAGTTKWTFDSVEGPIYAVGIGNTLGTNPIYFGDGLGDFYALRDAGTSAQVLWVAALDPAYGIAVSTSGTIYVATAYGNLVSLKPSGGENWSAALGSNMGSTPSIGPNGTIYVGCDNDMFAIADNGATYTKKWSFPTNEFVGSSAAIGANNAIYFGSDDGNLYAVTDNGASYTEKWAFNTEYGVSSVPVLDSDGTIFVASEGSPLYILKDLGTSAGVIGSTNVGTVDFSVPAIGFDGTLYLGNDLGVMYALNGKKLSNFTSSNSTLNGGATDGTGVATGTVTVSSPAGPNGDTVNLSSTYFNGLIPTSVTVPSGQTSATFTIDTNVVSSEQVGEVQATFGTWSLQIEEVVEPDSLSNYSVSPNTVTGKYDTTGTVTLSFAQSSDVTVTLSSDYSGVIVPASVTVPAGSSSANFYIRTLAASQPITAQLEASFRNNLLTDLTVEPYALSNFYVSPTSVVGNYRSNGVLQIAGPAGSQGNVVVLSSNNSCVTVPTYVTIPSGATGVSFQISTASVTTQTPVTLTASFNGASMQSTLTVNPYGLSNFYATPATVVGNYRSNGVVQLALAPSSDAAVSLSSDNSCVSVPATVTVPAGNTGVSFQISTSNVASPQTVTLTASYNYSTLETTLTVNPYAISNFYCNPSTVIEGHSTYCVVQLAGPAAAGGDVVTLSSPSAEVVVPSTVTVPAGTTGVSFLIQTTSIGKPDQVTITATLGPSSQQTTVTLNPPG